MCLSPKVYACTAHEADEGEMLMCEMDVGAELDVFPLFSQSIIWYSRS